MFAEGRNSTILEARQNISDLDLVSYYLGVVKLPIRICSPLREDRKPSFGLYTRDGAHVYWTDFATGDKGSIIELLQKLWGLNLEETWRKILKEFKGYGGVSVRKTISRPKIEVLGTERTKIETHERNWEKYDLEYWASFGITKDWLEFANVHPISHIIFIKENSRISMPADKLAYAYLEFKEGKVTTKVYQPKNTNGFKWFSSHDRSVVSLWTKVPYTGDKIVICSSLKDALCLWSNTGIPSLSLQGEGYGMSEHAINDLKERYKHIYILLDNDEPGIKDGIKLSEQTGFTNIVLPKFMGGKDVSDLMKVKGKSEFLKVILPLFNN